MKFPPMGPANTAAADMHNRAHRVPIPCGVSIFLVSLLGLFLELMLIRWISTEIRIFAYLQNTVLVVCFLGLGMGCFTCRQPASLRTSLLALATIVMVLAWPFTREAVASISAFFGQLDDLLIWQNSVATSAPKAFLSIAAGLAMTFGLMILLWEVFMPIGRLLGRYIEDHPHTVRAYSLNVAGSLAGIILFTVFSAMSTTPLTWLVVAALMTPVFLGSGRELVGNLLLLAIILTAGAFAGHEPGATEVVWSPYQKLALIESHSRGIQNRHTWPGEYLVLVNNAGYQGIIDLSETTVRDNPRIRPERYGLSQYDVPLLLHPHPKNVLIVGAGTGNDVAGALRAGAEHVTAVEIDPAIIAMGRRYHPEHPYDSPKVSIVNDDARSFFATTTDTFDLIIFGLLDSHTTTSMTNARLDHYVYTRESLQRARSLLRPGGVVSLGFEVAKPYIGDRMASTIRTVFGHEPLAFRIPQDDQGWGGVMFVAGNQASIRTGLSTNPRLADWIRRWQADQPVTLTYGTSETTDDWPYIYLQARRIPTLYYLLGFALIALALRCKKRLELSRLVSGWRASHWHFFFLGAAFLLLEVQNISKASVVLGNTWVVNAVIIASILVMILLANLTESRFGDRIPGGMVVYLLVGSCLALYFIDLSRFAFWPYASKATIVGALTTMPMFFSGIIFIRSFAAVGDKASAMGANMYGALAGGILQSVTFVTGIKALLLIVACLYVAAAILQPDRVAEAERSRALDKLDVPKPHGPGGAVGTAAP